MPGSPSGTYRRLTGDPPLQVFERLTTTRHAPNCPLPLRLFEIHVAGQHPGRALRHLLRCPRHQDSKSPGHFLVVANSERRHGLQHILGKTGIWVKAVKKLSVYQSDDFQTSDFAELEPGQRPGDVFEVTRRCLHGQTVDAAGSLT